MSPRNEPEYIPLSQIDPSLLPLPPSDHGHGSASSSRRSSLNTLTSVTGRRWRTRQYAVVLVGVLIGLGVFLGHPKGLDLAGLNGSELDQAMEGQGSYRPGRLGKGLLDRRRATLEASNAVSSSSSSSSSTSPAASSPQETNLFDLLAHRNEALCEGYAEGSEQEYAKRGCWRARMVEQVDRWGMEDADFWPSLASLNKQSIARLRRCLLDPSTTLSNDYPRYTDEEPLVPLNLSSVQDEVGVDTRPCSLTSTKVVLGNWWYFTMAYGDWSQSPGESVWLRNQMRALHELGYTIISTNTYKGMIKAHKAMPDVISQIWTEDRHTLTCQDDPYCADFETFKPTNEKYPGTAVDEKTHLPDFWNVINNDPGDTSQRWAWLNHELDQIPVEERGTIPNWKLFTTTYWGARPEDPGWGFTSEDFPWNALGQQWTLTPFAYPLHTYIPYSIEQTCSLAPHVTPLEKSEKLFVLAKQSDYFQDPWSSVPASFWAKVQNRTGLEVSSVASGDVPLPEGVHSEGLVSRQEFEVMVSKSKLMLGIGRPLISPSVYSALCQGTPVVIPYFKDVAVPPGWNLFNGAFAQHGPAAAIGPPYVYSYKTGDENDLVDKIKQAAANPIGRYIPPDMTYAAELQNMDDLMRFDWKSYGELVLDRGLQHKTPLRRYVVARCFKIGRCEPLHGGFD